MTETETVTFIDMILEACNKNPNGKAITDSNGGIVTYKALHEGILNVSSKAAQEIPENSKILFMLKPTAKNLTLALGLLRGGHTLIIVDPFTSTELLLSRTEKAEADFALVEKSLMLASRNSKLVSLLSRKNIADITKLPIPICSAGNKNNRYRFETWLERSPNQIVPSRKATSTEGGIIVFTSGTTSEPKGVHQTLNTLTAGMVFVKERLGIEQGSIVVSEPMTVGLVALASGAEWVQAFPKRAKNLNADVWFGTPHDAQLLAETASTLPTKPKIGTVGVGSGPVLPSLVKLIDKNIKAENILCIYGMTEILPIAIGDAREKQSYLNLGDYVGEPLPHVETKTVDGELLIKSSAVAKYVNYPNSEWLHTGDYGTVIEDGEYGRLASEKRIILQGRKKDMFIRRDMNIYPGLYEPKLNTIPGVSEAYLVGVPQNVSDDYIALAVKIETGHKEEQVHSRLTAAFSEAMDKEAFPDRIVFVKDIPKKGRADKVDREKLTLIVGEKLDKQ